MKVAIYARYSSDNQRDASIADQLRVCREFATRQGWTIIDEFTDHALSGATLLRGGFQALMRDALNGRFEVVFAEALDRFSRDQEDTAGLFKRLTFAGVNIVTLAEGDITHLHVGLKGTMNALFLKDLADKTRRGLRGRVELGKSGGGLCYGYKVSRATNGNADATGDREIVPHEAEMIRRIFRDYAAGLSPKAIAKRLNAERCPGPGGVPWNPSTIHGNPHVEAIVLEPDGERLKITLKGDLAGMLSAARDTKRSPDTGDLMLQIKLVAGARNQHYLQLGAPQRDHSAEVASPNDRRIGDDLHRPRLAFVHECHQLRSLHVPCLDLFDPKSWLLERFWD